ncbi:MAG TPA: N-acetyl-gamma-glutamyl-phosphate reductase [Streptosporangiaceae bacterium]|jgi:N-acetyl-gamma-glutamyl-phosphate reductase
MGIRVGVAGASGYAGGELLRLLTGHPDFEIFSCTAQASAGRPVTSVHPQLMAYAGQVFAPAEAAALAGADLVFMALPAGESARLAAGLPPEVKIVDLGADFRLADAQAWDRFYPSPYAGCWTYGLPELPGGRAQIAAAARVAAPGCYATAAIVALAPLLAGGLVAAQDLVIVAASGTSGAGRSPRTDLLGSEVMGSMRAYQVGGVHRHTPEIEQALNNLSRGVRLSFTPVLAPMPRGILATCTARLADGASEPALRAALAGAYDDEPFLHVLPAGQWPATAATAGSNAAQLQVAADEHAGRAVVVCALDNLGKGAAGQAIQCANLMLGLPETAGLTNQGIAP